MIDRARPADTPDDTALQEVEDQFVESWAAIATLWGVNRSSGRIHAILYLAAEPLDAAAIRLRLGISHGNVSTSIRDLLAWGVIRRLHRPGERRALYEAEQSPWAWFHRCISERRRREVVPVLEALHAVSEIAGKSARAAQGNERRRQVYERIERFAGFSEEFVDLIDVFLAVGAGRMGKLLRGAAKLLPKGSRR